MSARKQVEAWLSLLAALAILTPTAVAAYPAARQDSRSKELLALPPAEADRVRRRDLLADLQPTGQFVTDLNGNVYGMTLVTWPHRDRSLFVCREYRLTLLDDSAIDDGWMEAQPLFYVDGDPSISGDDRTWQGCDHDHPGPKAHWFSAPTASDALQVVQIFREAEDEVASGVVTPAPCERSAPDACRQWILSLKDPDKIDSVNTCQSGPGPDVCYVISIGDERLTISARMYAGGKVQDITAIKVEHVTTVIE